MPVIGQPSHTHFTPIVSAVALDRISLSVTYLYNVSAASYRVSLARTYLYDLRVIVSRSQVYLYHVNPVAPTGPTRLYFHNAIHPLTSFSNLPNSERSTLTSNKVVDNETINRFMNTIIGTAQTSKTNTANATTALQRYYFTRFVSETLSGAIGSITAQTWTYNFAGKGNTVAANFPVSSTNQPVRVTAYVWRPSTSSKVGDIVDGNSASTVDEVAATEKVHHTTFSGNQVLAVQQGDVLCFEVWFEITQAGAQPLTEDFYYDGTTVNTTKNATVTNHASFLETPQGLAFGAALTRVSKASIQKYNIIGRLSPGFSQTYKYNLTTLASLSQTYRYNIASAVSLSRSYLYDLTGRLSLSSIIKYNILLKISVPKTFRYALQSTLQSSKTYLYNIATAVGTVSSVYKYNIANAAQLVQTYKYQIYRTVQLSRLYKYSLIARLAQASVYKYNIATRLSQARIYRYAIAVKLSLSRAYKYNILISVSASSHIRYSILSKLSASKIYKYNIATVVTKSQVYKYHLTSLAHVVLSSIYKYNLLSRRSASRIYGYNIANRLSLSRIYRYNLTNIVPTLSSIYRYAITNRVTISRIYRYRLGEIVSLGRTYLYNMIARVRKSFRYNYAIGVILPGVTWQLTGKNSDFPDSLENLVKEFIEINWSTTDPVIGQTPVITSKLSRQHQTQVDNFAYDSYRSYYIRIKEVASEVKNRQVRLNTYEFETPIEVETYARRLSKSEAYPQLNAMINELLRIFGTYQAEGIFGVQGITLDRISSMEKERPPAQNIWGRKLRIILHYYRVSVVG